MSTHLIPTAEQIIAFSELSPSAKRKIVAVHHPQNFLIFVSYFFSEYIKYPFAPFHADFAQDLMDLTDGVITQLVWCTSRDTAKTSFAQMYLTWLIVNSPEDASDYFNVDSHDKTNSETFLFEVILSLQKNERLLQTYGHLFNAPKSFNEKVKKQVSDFITTNNVRVEAHSTQEPVRGRKHGASRPSVVVLDDFETLTTARSPLVTSQIWDHFSEFSAGLDQTKGRLLYLCNWITNTGNVARLKAKAENDPSMRFREVWRLNDDGRPSWPERDVLTDAELLLPHNEGKVSIETKKREMWNAETGDAEWEREMMGNPVDPMGDGPDDKGFSALFTEPLRTRVLSSESSRKPFEPHPPYALGVDPAGQGTDESVIVLRSAFQAKVYASEKKSTPMSLTRLVCTAMRECNVPAEQVVVDAFGVGFKTAQQLAVQGHNVVAVNVGEKELIDLNGYEGYLNDRAWLYFQLRDWLAKGGELCYDDRWEKQLKTIRHRSNEKNIRQIIPKKEIVRRGFASPDALDALMLSMYVDLTNVSTKVRYAEENPVSKFIR